jgi:hypothetical protein
MLGSVCLLGSNLNIQAKPEKLGQYGYNWHLNLSPKHQDPDLQVKQLAMEWKNGNSLQSIMMMMVMTTTVVVVEVKA